MNISCQDLVLSPMMFLLSWQRSFVRVGINVPGSERQADEQSQLTLMFWQTRVFLNGNSDQVEEFPSFQKVLQLDFE